MIMSNNDRQQVKKSCSWEQIKFRLNENLLNKKNIGSEFLADSTQCGAKHFNSNGTIFSFNSVVGEPG